MKYSTASKRQPTSSRGVVHSGQGTRNEHCFSWHLRCAKHSIRCFVSFVFNGIVELGRYHDPRVTDEKLGQRESWSPDLYWWVWKPTAPSVKAMEDKQNGFPTPWKCVKGAVLWQQGSKRSAWNCLLGPTWQDGWSINLGSGTEIAALNRGVLGTGRIDSCKDNGCRERPQWSGEAKGLEPPCDTGPLPSKDSTANFKARAPHPGLQ